MKKFLATLLAVAMLLVPLSAAVFADEAETPPAAVEEEKTILDDITHFFTVIYNFFMNEIFGKIGELFNSISDWISIEK